MKKYLFSLTLTMIFHCFGYGQTVSDLIGTWHNPLGSTLKITSVNASTSQMSGTYTLNSGKQFPLVGWVNDLPPANDHVLALAFSVRFGSYGTITSWTGYLKKESTGLKITTLWHYVMPNSDLPWDHIVTNCDVFTPGPAPQKKK